MVIITVPTLKSFSTFVYRLSNKLDGNVDMCKLCTDICLVSSNLYPASYELYRGFWSSTWNWVLCYHSTDSHYVMKTFTCHCCKIPKGRLRTSKSLLGMIFVRRASLVWNLFGVYLRFLNQFTFQINVRAKVDRGTALQAGRSRARSPMM